MYFRHKHVETGPKRSHDLATIRYYFPQVSHYVLLRRLGSRMQMIKNF